jgi:hypothetical protein
MKWGGGGFRIILLTCQFEKKSYITFNNSKINNLQIHDIAQNYRILLEVVQRLSQHNLKILKHRHIKKFRQKK